MVLMSTTSVPPRCDANATGRTATDWGMEALPCQTRVGLRSFIDRQGTRRFYCSAWAHKANIERRFGVQTDEQRRVALAIDRISSDFRDEIEDEDDFDYEGQPEFNGSFR